LTNNNAPFYNNSVWAYAIANALLITCSIVMAALHLAEVPVLEGAPMLITNAIYSVTLGVAAVAILLVTKQPVVNALGLRKQAFSGKKLLLLCATVLVLLNVSVVLNGWFMSVLVNLGFDLPTVSLTTELIKQHPVLTLVAACILPAINEEILFRGLITKGLSQRFGNVASVLMTGALFALFHGNPAQTIHQFALGCMLAMVAISTQSVVLPVIVHFFNNLSALLLALFVEPTGVYDSHGWLIVLLGGALLAGLAMPFYNQFKLPQAQVVKMRLGWRDVLLVATAAFSSLLWIGAL